MWKTGGITFHLERFTSPGLPREWKKGGNKHSRWKKGGKQVESRSTLNVSPLQGCPGSGKRWK